MIIKRVLPKQVGKFLTSCTIISFSTMAMTHGVD